MRIFGSERLSNVMERLGIEEDQPIEHKWITKSIENAQKKVEGHNFGIRKNVLEYDDVMNQQRKTIYAMRRDILTGGQKNKAVIYSMIEEIVNEIILISIPERSTPASWDFDGIKELVNQLTTLESDRKLESILDTELYSSMKAEKAMTEIAQKIYDHVLEVYDNKMGQYTDELSSEMERHIVLEVLDLYWRRHLLNMDHLREGIGLRGYGQKNPKLEYKREGFRMFTEMMSSIYNESVKRLFAVQVVTEEAIEKFEEKEQKKEAQIQRSTTNMNRETVKRKAPKVGRNDPCPCGSGQKFKKCCMNKGIYD